MSLPNFRLLAGLLLLTACSGGKGPVTGPPSQVVAKVLLFDPQEKPASLSLTVGSSMQLHAVAYNADNIVVSNRTPQWTSSDETKATVDQLGSVRAVGIGSAAITATVDGIVGSAPVAVSPVPVSSVVITPANPPVEEKGGLRQLTATAMDAAGNVLSGRTATWTSSAPDKAKIDPVTGLVTGVAVGTATITATIETKSQTTTITVVAGAPVGTIDFSFPVSSIQMDSSVTPTLVLKDADGKVLNGRQVSWSTDNAAVGTINVTTGVVTGRGPGALNVTASIEGKTKTVALTIRAAWMRVSVGSLHACAIATSGAAYCWGSNQEFELGLGPALTAAGPETCVRSGGDRFGVGVDPCATRPRAVAGGLLFKEISAGEFLSCALAVDSSVYCWGIGGGVGATSDIRSSVPVKINLPGPAVSVSASRGFACAAGVDGKVFCWGFIPPDRPYTVVPVEMPGFAADPAAEVQAGFNFACGRTRVGNILCWGNNSLGQLTGTGPASQVPQRADIFFATSLTLGNTHACARIASGGTMCWGSNLWSQVDGIQSYTAPDIRATPVALPLSLTAVSAGEDQTCGLTAVPSVPQCWGRRPYSKAPPDGGSESISPVSGALPMTAINVGFYSVCGITSAREIFCWGQDMRGLLGTDAINDLFFHPPQKLDEPR